jgi:hypothetical protein
VTHGRALDATDERPHVAPDPCPRWWSETWTFDFCSTAVIEPEGDAAADTRGDAAGDAAGAGVIGGYAWFTVLPAQHRCWYWSALVRSGERLVSLVDLDVPMSRAVLEIRSSALWAMHVCEEPLSRWTVGNEAFGVALDDPADALAEAYGELVPIGFDLEWEATGEATTHAPTATTGYTIDATVHGEVLVGADRLAIDGTGYWTHRWGEHDWARSTDAGDLHAQSDALEAPIRLDVDNVIVDMHAMLSDGVWRYAFAARR